MSQYMGFPAYGHSGTVVLKGFGHRVGRLCSVLFFCLWVLILISVNRQYSYCILELTGVDLIFLLKDRLNMCSLEPGRLLLYCLEALLFGDAFSDLSYFHR